MGREAFLPPRGVGIPAAIILPPPPPEYSPEDQKAVREILQKFGQQVPDWTAVASVPPTVATLAAAPALTPFAVTLLGALTATAARVLLGIIEHRSSQLITTASLADGTSENGSAAMPDTVVDLLSVVTDRACWVRLYTTAAARTADSARAFGTQPTAGTGVLAEFVATGAQTIPCSPVARLANGDVSPTGTVYYTIMNRSGATHTVAVTLGYGALP